MRSFWFWKRSPEPLLGSFLDVQRYLQNPNSRVVSGIYASFSRVLEPWAVQNIQKGKKVVECKSCRANRNVQKDVEQQKYGNHPLPAVIVARGCLCLGTEIANSPCSWFAGNMSDGERQGWRGGKGHDGHTGMIHNRAQGEVRKPKCRRTEG